MHHIPARNLLLPLTAADTSAGGWVTVALCIAAVVTLILVIAALIPKNRK